MTLTDYCQILSNQKLLRQIKKYFNVLGHCKAMHYKIVIYRFKIGLLYKLKSIINCLNVHDMAQGKLAFLIF